MNWTKRRRRWAGLRIGAAGLFQEASELPYHRLAMLRRFFQDYKQPEGKAVEVDEFQDSKPSLPIIEHALQAYSERRRRGLLTKLLSQPARFPRRGLGSLSAVSCAADARTAVPLARRGQLPFARTG